MTSYNPKSIYQFTRIITEAFQSTKEGQSKHVLIQEKDFSGKRALIEYGLSQIEETYISVSSMFDSDSITLASWLNGFVDQLEACASGYSHMEEPAKELLNLAKEKNRTEEITQILHQLIVDIVDMGLPLVWQIDNYQWACEDIASVLELLTSNYESPMLLIIGIRTMDENISIGSQDIIQLEEIAFDKLEDVQMTDLGLSRIHLLKMRVYKEAQKYDMSLDEAVKGLKLLGIKIHKKPTVYNNLKVINKLKGKMTRRRLGTYLERKEEIDEERQLQKILLTELSGLALNFDDDLLFSVMLHLSLVVSQSAPDAYSALGLTGYVLTSLYFLEDETDVEHLQEIIFTLLDHYPNEQVKALTYYINGTHIYHSYESMGHTMAILDEAVVLANTLGDWMLSVRADLRLLDTLIIGGRHTIELQEKLANIQGKIGRSNLSEDFEITTFYKKAFYLMAQGTKGEVEESGLMLDKLDEFSEVNQLTIHLLRIRVAQLYGLLSLAEASLTAANKLRKHVQTYFMTHSIEFFEGLQIAYKWFEKSHGKQLSKVNRLGQLQKLYAYKVEKNPDLFGSSYKLLLGIKYMVIGDYDEAMTQLEFGLDLATEHDQKYLKAMLSEVLCSSAAKSDLVKSELYYGLVSYDAFKDLGIKHKVSAYNKRYKIDLAPESVVERWQDGNLAFELSPVISSYERIMLATNKDDLKTSYFEEVKLMLEPRKLRVVLEEKFTYKIDRAMNDDVLGMDIEEARDESKKIIRHVLYDNESIVVNLERLHPIALYDAYIMDIRGVCMMCVPLLYHSIIVGVIYIERTNEFTPQETRFCEELSERFAYLLFKDEMPSSGEIVLDAVEQSICDQFLLGSSHKVLSEHLQINNSQLEHHVLTLYEKFETHNHGKLMSKLIK